MEDANIKDSIVFRDPSSVNLCAECNPPVGARGPNSTHPVWVTRGGGREVAQLQIYLFELFDQESVYQVCSLQTPEQPLRSESTRTLGLTSGGRLSDPLLLCDKQNLFLSGTLYVADKEDDDWVGLVFSYQSANAFYALISAKHCCGPTLSAGQRGKLRRQGPWRLVRVNSTTGVATRHLARAVVALRSVRDQTMVLWPGRLNLHIGPQILENHRHLTSFSKNGTNLIPKGPRNAKKMSMQK